MPPDIKQALGPGCIASSLQQYLLEHVLWALQQSHIPFGHTDMLAKLQSCRGSTKWCSMATMLSTAQTNCSISQDEWPAACCFTICSILQVQQTGNRQPGCMLMHFRVTVLNHRNMYKSESEVNKTKWKALQWDLMNWNTFQVCQYKSSSNSFCILDLITQSFG